MKVTKKLCWRCSLGATLTHLPEETLQKILSMETTEHGVITRCECILCKMHNTFITDTAPETLEVKCNDS